MSEWKNQISVYKPQNFSGTWKIRIKRMGKINYICCHDERDAFEKYEELQKANGLSKGSIQISINEYLVYLSVKGRKTSSIATTTFRLKSFLGDLLPLSLISITEEKLRNRYTERAERVAGDTSRNELNEARSFFRWLEKKGICKNYLEDVEADCSPRRKRQKEKLRPNEANKLLSYCLQRGDENKLAVALVLSTGCRAGEITSRAVRDYDPVNKVLFIENGKTASSNRVVPILNDEVCRQLDNLTKGKDQNEPIFSYYDYKEKRTRHHKPGWIRDTLKSCCVRLGLPVVCAHGLRGTFATMARIAGIDRSTLISLLGHTGYGVTSNHYVANGTDANKEIEAVNEVLG